MIWTLNSPINVQYLRPLCCLVTLGYFIVNFILFIEYHLHINGNWKRKQLVPTMLRNHPLYPVTFLSIGYENERTRSNFLSWNGKVCPVFGDWLCNISFLCGTVSTWSLFQILFRLFVSVVRTEKLKTIFKLVIYTKSWVIVQNIENR